MVLLHRSKNVIYAAIYESLACTIHTPGSQSCASVGEQDCKERRRWSLDASYLVRESCELTLQDRQAISQKACPIERAGILRPSVSQQEVILTSSIQ